MGIFEFLEVDDSLRQMVLEGKGEADLRKKAIESGTKLLMADGFNKVEQGLTTIEEILSLCPPPDSFK